VKKLEGFKILVVEDDPDLREIVADDFSMAGGDVHWAESGNKALKMVLAGRYDFILSDMRMSDGDGRYLAQKILEIPVGRRPVFFLYSGFNDLDAQQVQQLEIREVFCKPIRPSQMIDSICRYFTQKMHG
jgi:CheY-like chemotaxis protein